MVKSDPKPLSLWWFIPFALLFLVQVAPRLAVDSPAGDEAVDMGDGYFYWKGDVISDAHHPPMAKALQALPLWATGLESKSNAHFSRFERRDYNFLFVLNRDRFMDMAFRARCVTLLFGLGLGLLLFLAAREISREAAFFTLALWAFEPNLLAYSGLVMADVPLAFFLLAAVLVFRRKAGPFSWKRAAGTGLLAGMAVTTKFSAAVLPLVFIVLEFLDRRDGAGKGRPWARASRWAWGILAAFLWINLIYLPGTLKIPGFRFPFSYFWDGFRSTAAYSGHPTYFLGDLSAQNHWAYYPVAFLLKSPLPFLLFLGTGTWLALARRLRLPAWQWVTPVLFFAAMMPFLNIGVRQVLPVFPFLILIAAQGAAWLWSKGKGRRGLLLRCLIGVLLAFQASSVLLSYPSQISYENEGVASEKKLYWLGDSNLDLGLDAKRLAEVGRRRGWQRVKLAYFGETDPALYGLKWDYWTRRDLAGPQPGWVYAVNMAFLQLGPAYFPAAAAIDRGWITHREPTGMAGSTWYYYECPGEAEADPTPSLASAPPFKYFEGLH